MTEFNYDTLISLPEDLSLGPMLKFLAKTKNTRLRPATLDSDCPPFFFWWFENESTAASQFIQEAFETFPWKTQWTIESRDNNKWLLYPEKIREAEKIVKKSSDGNIEVTDAGVAWLMNNEPEFGRTCNKELDEFRKFFRSELEKYLKNKEKAV